MPVHVLAIVLCGAFLHATWNAVVKGGDDKLLGAVLVVTAAGLIAALLLPFLPQPARASWPYLAGSAVLQTIYILLLATAYRHGDMSQTYPLTRGTAPLIVALLSGAVVGEQLPALAWVGLGLICAGILGLMVSNRRGASATASLVALVNAVAVASYTLVDGIGVRLSQAPAGYTMWLFVLNALPLAIGALALSRRRVVAYARSHVGRGLVGGVGTLGSYGLALWAMTVAPVAMVAALRETSILFGTAISVLVLGEKVTAARIAMTVVIAAGAATLRAA